MSSSRSKYVIVVAGGSGSRMGADVPKQFLPLGGVPILQRTIERFRQACPDARFITVLPSAHVSRWKELCSAHALNVPQMIVAGGITRFHSVQNALARVPDGALVAIHDGVRPLCSAGLARKAFDLAESVPAVIPVVPVCDTLKNKNPEGPDPDRAFVVAAQTPQVFWSECIRAAYREQGYRTEFTDDASVAKAQKIPLSYIEGERRNIKITTSEDLALAELFLGL